MIHEFFAHFSIKTEVSTVESRRAFRHQVVIEQFAKLVLAYGMGARQFLGNTICDDINGETVVVFERLKIVYFSVFHAFMFDVVDETDFGIDG